MAESRREEARPPVVIQLLEQRLAAMEHQFERHVVTQNSHLASIDQHLAKLSETVAENRTERANQVGALAEKLNDQIGDLAKSLSELSTRLLLAGVGFLASAVLGLLYILFGHALK